MREASSSHRVHRGGCQQSGGSVTSLPVLIRFVRRAALLLLVSGTAACVSEEAECHRRAVAMLGCCPSCDGDCEVSNDPDAKFAMESCLATLDQQRAGDHQRQDQSSASEGDASTTKVEGSGEATFGGTW